MALEQAIGRAVSSAVNRVVMTAVQNTVKEKSQEAEQEFAEERKKVTTSGFHAGVTIKYVGAWPLLILYGLLALFFTFIFFGDPDPTFAYGIPGFFWVLFFLMIFLKKYAKKQMYILQFNYHGIWIFDQEGTELDFIDGGSISAKDYHLNKLKVHSETGKKYVLKRVRGENWDAMTELFNLFNVV